MKTQKQHSAAFLKKRQFFLVLPLLVLPFMTLIFWAMGGGTDTLAAPTAQQGLNDKLPDAQLDKNSLDKMSLYQQAQKDSAASHQDSFGVSGWEEFAGADSLPTGMNLQPQHYGSYQTGYHDPYEQQVQQRLAELERLVREPASDPMYMSQNTGYHNDDASVRKLEQMMETMTAPAGSDPEVDQLTAMLDRVIDIQHPDRMREKLKAESLSKRGAVLPVSKPQEPAALALVSNSTEQSQGTFWGIDRDEEVDTIRNYAVSALIPETQTLVSGATLKMKLAEDIYIKGILIPAGQEVFGKCSLEGERLLVGITGIRYGKRLFPISLSVYGLDAIEGISIPGAITRDAAKESADRTIQTMQFMNMDPSLGAQAAGAGIEAVRGLMSKKIKLIKVTVNAGTPVLLYNKQSEN